MDSITLPDGRQIAIRDIKNQVTNRANHNLRTRKTVKKPVNRVVKYTIQDRIWLATTTVEAIQSRYQVSEETAQSLKYQSRYVLQRLDIDVADIQQRQQELDSKSK